jgi:hypothetical protein
MDVRTTQGLRTFAISLALGSMLGCGTRTEWFPMKLGNHWNYQVRAGFDRRVEPVKVLRALTVASTDGFELAGPLGVSRLAWKHGVLLAESTVNARFAPPLPLLIPGADLSKSAPKQVAIWHGRVVTLGRERPGSAVITEQLEKIDVGSQKVSTILATVTLHTPSGKIELDSWYQEGVGLVQQEQRTNGVRIVQLQLLDHGD